jgi:hypothetical protein
MTAYNDMFDYLAAIMGASVKKKNQWKKDLFFAAKLAQQELSKYYTVVPPTMGKRLISAHLINPFRML